MKIPSDIKYIRKVSSEIESLLRAKKVSDALIFDIRLSVEEAVRNAIVHGNRGKRDLPVIVSYSIGDDKVTIEVEDRGKGFNLADVPNPTKKENLLKTGGRGVFLMKKLMDEVKYNDSGNKIFMLKFTKDKKGGSNAN